MKLLLCSNCNDVFSLNMYLKRCSCGGAEGQYVDKINATYSGKDAVPLGFNNLSVVEAVREQPKTGWGKEFKAFVIPKNCPTYNKIDGE